MRVWVRRKWAHSSMPCAVPAALLSLAVRPAETRAPGMWDKHRKTSAHLMELRPLSPEVVLESLKRSHGSKQAPAGEYLGL